MKEIEKRTVAAIGDRGPAAENLAQRRGGAENVEGASRPLEATESTRNQAASAPVTRSAAALAVARSATDMQSPPAGTDVPTMSGLATVHLFVFDSMGNVRYKVRVGGGTAVVIATYEYDPYGRMLYADPPPLQETAPQFLFSTKQYESHWQHYYYGYRFYSPDLGRWLSRDPIGEEDGPNVYGFVRNSVNNRVDVLGLKCVTDRVNVNLGSLFDAAQKIGAKCSISAYVRADIERCDGCCDQKYTEHAKVSASLVGSGGVNCVFPIPYASIPYLNTGINGTLSGMLNFGGSVTYDACNGYTSGTGSGSIIILLGLQAALMNNWAGEVSVTGEGGGSCSLTLDCEGSQCVIYGQCCLRARARVTARIWGVGYSRMWNAPSLCTKKGALATISLF